MKLLGVECDALGIDDLNQIVLSTLQGEGRVLIANHNVNSVRLFHRDRDMRTFYDAASHIHIDGMPLIAAGRLLGHRLERRHRVTYVDWVMPLMGLAAAYGWRVFYLGSAPGVAERGAARLRARFPQLSINTCDGYFDIEGESDRILGQIASARADILFVGMGMPRQERWILKNLDRIPARVILQAGACMDYVAGQVRTPPRVLGRLGLEWAFRLVTEPRRLWRRYLVEPWFVLGLLLKEVISRSHLVSRRSTSLDTWQIDDGPADTGERA